MTSLPKGPWAYRPLGLYIHIPFCKRKCHYCDFVSYTDKEMLMDKYVEALCREINSPPQSPSLEKRGGRKSSVIDCFSPLSCKRGDGGELSTIYFGGGTPTLLEPKHFNQIISTIISHWSLDISRSEISVEANPGTADLAKLRALRQLGINRLSIGVQSFNDRHLKTLGRIHTAASAVKFYENARAAGFDNINLDLIFSLPGQTLAAWQSDLQMALGLAPDHLSTYNLELGEGTPLHKMVMKPATKRRGFQETETFSLRFPGQLQLPNEDTELAMYEHAIETLTAAGFKHYEISNFAKPGFECRHNLNYWRNGNYLGAGAGAHSHWQGKRWANPELIEEYISNDTRWTKDASSSEADRRETIFMGLRLLDGLTIEKFAGFELEVGELIRDGLLKRRNGHYQLTRRGLYLANLVFAKFV